MILPDRAEREQSQYDRQKGYGIIGRMRNISPIIALFFLLVVALLVVMTACLPEGVTPAAFTPETPLSMPDAKFELVRAGVGEA